MLGFSLGLSLRPFIVDGGVTPPPVAPGYLATVASAPLAVYGHQRFIAGYNGPLFQLARSSDGATMDVTPPSGGDYPDADAIAAWAGSAALFIAKYYNQTGDGKNLEQPTAGNRLRYDLSQISYPAGPPGLMGTFGSAPFMVAGGFSFDRQDISYMAVDECQAPAQSSPFIRIEDSAGNVSQLFFIGTGRLGVFETAAVYATQTAGWVRAQPVVTGLRSTAAERRIFNRETNFTISGGAAAGTATHLRMGIGNPFSNDPARKIWCIAVYPALSTTDMNTAMDSLRVACSVRTTFDRRLLIGGDSISIGQQLATYMRTAAYGYLPQLQGDVEFVNRGIGGSTLATLDTDYASTSSQHALARFYTSEYGASKCGLVIQRGTNDLFNGTSGAAAYALTTSIVGKAKATGYRVAVCTVLPRASFDTAKETERLAYNAAVRANAAGADVIIDFAANPVMGDGTGAQNNPALYPDGTHISDLGYEPLVPQYVAGIDALWTGSLI